ncbi:MSMEG_0565 family glycosyltransferase [Candidatus Methylospira mobilis]|uniref:MSMEG_0565 family glycosyltransferase n=1 Tax=Candidatus Methylospira mobilis TaxID=1808979 RepID=A0A5Q0BEC4_9GAMM|nr:MSMEG_0565 family glycosyltransferase [Candidatus Methylospira mobilis]QFY42223.1 MSMEG_0565 family glycosyltransferase [Candidatus Methylospira mobilis]
MSPLRIAMLAHSTNPRGGVVHALELAEALHAQGQRVTLIAAAEHGKAFFRKTFCATQLLTLPVLSGDLSTQVEQRIRAYVEYFSRPDTPRYDIYHAQDAISGCALAMLSERGILPGFVRTVHHLDTFGAADLAAWQARSFREARQVLCVSRHWREKLADEHGINAIEINNGVDTRRFHPTAQPEDESLRSRLGLNRSGPLFLAVGGIEARKNTLRIFHSFLDVLKNQPQAQLLIAGGASLLDHSGYRQAFDDAVKNSGIAEGPDQPLVISGPLPDAAMPSLFRLADALVFPSLQEGFGLVVLEAIVSGTPVIVSRRPPFSEYLQEHDCVWTDPEERLAIAAAMKQAIGDFPRQRLAATASRLASEFSWETSARTHLKIYQSIINPRGNTHA